MNEYKTLYHELGLPEQLISIAFGKIKLCRGTDSQPTNCYGFPPAMVPIWSNPDAMIYTAYWKHWFSSREPSFVELFVTNSYSLREISRGMDQLLQLIVLQEITFDDDLTENTKLLAKKLGVKNINELDQITIEHGDNPRGLLLISDFKDSGPLSAYKDAKEYTGDFPNEHMQINQNSLSNICTLEVYGELEKKILASPDCPYWFKAKNKKDLFYQYLSENEYSHAWFTLNSRGWLFKDVRKALQALGNAVDDSKFHALVEAWCSLNHSDYNDGY